MKISKKTGYAMLIISSFCGLVQCILMLLNNSASLLGNLSLAAFGLAALLLMWNASGTDKRLMFLSFFAFIFCMANFFPLFGNFGVFAWCCFALYNIGEKQIKAPSTIVLAFGVAMFIFSFIPFVVNSFLYLLFSTAYTLIQLWLSYAMFKNEEASSI